MKTHVKMSTYGVHCVQGINAVKMVRHQGTIIQYWSKVKRVYLWIPSTWYEYVGIPINMYDIPDVYLLQCPISRQPCAIYHIPVKFQAIAMLISRVYCLYTPERKLETKGGDKQSHSNDHIMRYLNEWRTCTLKTACTSHVALVCVCTHKRSFAYNICTR